MREEASQLSEQLRERDEQLRTTAGELAASRTAAEAAAAATTAARAAAVAAEADAAGAVEATTKLRALQSELTACKEALRCAVRVLLEFDRDSIGSSSAMRGSMLLLTTVQRRAHLLARGAVRLARPGRRRRTGGRRRVRWTGSLRSWHWRKRSGRKGRSASRSRTPHATCRGTESSPSRCVPLRFCCPAHTAETWLQRLLGFFSAVCLTWRTEERGPDRHLRQTI